MTLESQDNKTAGDGSVRCCDNGDMDEKHECLIEKPDTVEAGHASTDLVEGLLKDFETWSKNGWGKWISAAGTVEVSYWLPSKLNEVISRTREEAYEKGIAASIGESADAFTKYHDKGYERGKEQGIREERERILRALPAVPVVQFGEAYEDNGIERDLIVKIRRIIESGKSE